MSLKEFFSTIWREWVFGFPERRTICGVPTSLSPWYWKFGKQAVTEVGSKRKNHNFLLGNFLEARNKTCWLVRQGNIPKYSTDDTWWSCTVFSISFLNTFQTAGNQAINLWDNSSREDPHCTLNSLGNLSFRSALMASQRKISVCCRIQHFLVERQKKNPEITEHGQEGAGHPYQVKSLIQCKQS